MISITESQTPERRLETNLETYAKAILPESRRILLKYLVDLFEEKRAQ